MRYVSAFCPQCHADDPDRPLAEVTRLAGYLAERDDRVWLVRGCSRHGRVETMYDESPEILRWLEQWTAPTKRHTPDRPGNFDAIPVAYLKGLGEMQTQHTCILLEDIIATCNLSCPTCFADSSPQVPGLVPIEDVLANVDWQGVVGVGGRDHEDRPELAIVEERRVELGFLAFPAVDDSLQA